MNDMELILERWKQYEADEQLNEQQSPRQQGLGYFSPEYRPKQNVSAAKGAGDPYTRWGQYRADAGTRQRIRQANRLQRKDPAAYQQQVSDRRAKIAQGQPAPPTPTPAQAQDIFTFTPSGQNTELDRQIAGMHPGMAMSPQAEPGDWIGPTGNFTNEDPSMNITSYKDMARNQRAGAAANKKAERKEQNISQKAAGQKKAAELARRQETDRRFAKLRRANSEEASERIRAKRKEERKAGQAAKMKTKHDAYLADVASVNNFNPIEDPSIADRASSLAKSIGTGVMPLGSGFLAGEMMTSDHPDLADAELTGTVTSAPIAGPKGGLAAGLGNITAQAVGAVPGMSAEDRRLRKQKRLTGEDPYSRNLPESKADSLEVLVDNIKPLVVEILKRMRQHE